MIRKTTKAIAPATAAVLRGRRRESSASPPVLLVSPVRPVPAGRSRRRETGPPPGADLCGCAGPGLCACGGTGRGAGIGPDREVTPAGAPAWGACGCGAYDLVWVWRY